MKNLLITGGSGFIGSHLCLILLKNNYSLYVLDSFINSSYEALNRVKALAKFDKKNIDNNLKVFVGDMRDKKTIDNVFRFAYENNKRIDGVIHLASLKSVKESIEKPIDYWGNNIISTLNLVEIMIKYNCFNIVFSSSASIYQKDQKFVNEESFINPLHPYAETKVIIEMLLKSIFNAYQGKWKIVNLRYFNPIGAHSSGQLGEDPKGDPNNIFPRIIKVASGEIKKLYIFGNDWPTRDGSGIRDYIHVMDLAEGHLKALEYLNLIEPKILNINLGTGIGTTVIELVKVFEKVNNVKIPIAYEERRNGDVSELVADISLAKSLINFFPSRSIQDMCKDGWKWYLNNPEGYENN
jgi:UDP-glucose 4-epimerase